MRQQNPEIPGKLPDVLPGNVEKKHVENEAREAREMLSKEIQDMNEKSKKKLEKAFSYIEKENFNEAKVREMLNISRNMSVYDLWRGGIARMKNEEGLKENQGFDRMAAQFAKRKVDENGRAYLEINLHRKSKFEMNIGAGHICPPSWKRVAIVDLEGNVRVGERRVPGKDNVRGGKIGYFDDQGRYLVVFSGYKVYPLSVLSDGNENDKKIINEQTEKESTFYRENKEEIEKYVIREASYNVNRAEMSRVEIQRIRDQISGLEEIKDPGEHEQLHMSERNKQELISRGSMPFEVRVGYKLTPEEYRWYRGTQREGQRLSRLSMNQRWDILEERYNLRHAVNYAAEMLGISQANFKMFFAFNDAILRTESNYNPFCINTVRDGNTLRCARSTAAGEYQIVHGTWGKGRTRRAFFGNSSNADRNRRGLSRIGIDPELVANINLDSPRAEFATPHQRAIFFNFYFVRYSRALGGLESIDNIFDNIRNTRGKRRDSWIRLMYTYWRNGPGGAQALVRNLRNGIDLPKTRDEAQDYFDKHLNSNDWQKKRGFLDFWNLMKATNVFKRRFNKNMSEI